MSVIRILMAAYFLGMAIFLLTIIAAVLAIFGIETIGSRVPLFFPIVTSVVLVAGSKIAAGRILARAEKQHG